MDDGSDDGGATSAVARRYGDRITLLSHANIGVAGTLNRIMRAMTGEYFTWLSHDDVFEPEKTRRQVEVHREAGGAEDVVLFSDFCRIDAAGAVTSVERLDATRLASRPRLAFYDGLIHGCTIFIARALLAEMGGFDEACPHTQDYQLWWRLARRARFLHVPEQLVRVRQHPRQGSYGRAAREESERLWMSVLNETSVLDACLLDGSQERFFRRSAEFLQFRSPNRNAAALARSLAQTAAAAARTTVIVDLGLDRSGAVATIASVLAQTRKPDQLVLLGRLPTTFPPPPAGSDVAVVQIEIDDERPSARLRAGLFAATGDYIGFLLAPDTFEPDKLLAQVRRMSQAGGLVSHTSYSRPDGTIVPAGTFSGAVYPEILGGPPIETSTVMINRLLWIAGLLFTDADAPVGASWIEASAGRELVGVDEPLSRLEPRAAAERTALHDWMRSHPLHAGQTRDLARLQATLAPTMAPA